MPVYQIAVLADIHGNLPALEAVLQDTAGLQLDGLVAAGDMVGGPDQKMVLQILRDRQAYLIQGNWEERMVSLAKKTAPRYYQTASQYSMLRWLYQDLTDEALSFLAGLPIQRVIHLPGSDPIRILHGSQTDTNEGVYPQNPEQLQAILDKIPEPVVGFGHTHTQWIVKFPKQLAFNPGSLYGPYHFRGAQYALLTWNESEWQVSLRQVAYDITAVEKRYRESGFINTGPLPRLFLRILESGEHLERPFLDFAHQKARQAGLSSSPYIPDEIWDTIWDEFIQDQTIK